MFLPMLLLIFAAVFLEASSKEKLCDGQTCQVNSKERIQTDLNDRESKEIYIISRASRKGALTSRKHKPRRVKYSKNGATYDVKQQQKFDSDPYQKIDTLSSNGNFCGMKHVQQNTQRRPIHHKALNAGREHYCGCNKHDHHKNVKKNPFHG